jgi:Holliday junction DNA helicase RuvA
MVLFGFPTRDERDTFEALIGATGVGPKLALAILSVHTPSALRRCLVDDDLDALVLVPGVGKRTAQRLLVELKSRLEVPDLDLTGPAANGTSARGEVRDALTGLGYSSDEVRDTLGQLPEDGTVEDLLRDALRLLGARR